MKEFKAIIIDPIGLHARLASIVSSEALKYKSEIKITLPKFNKEGNLKSIMILLAMNIRKNDEIIVKATGEDEELAIKELEKVFKEANII
ncbi:HPr family phosphocarrier protein [Mycoplasmopsis columbina]|uniref:Phosphocarrier protein hpr n=1 Tax=Mycoplasmopsis columbina SF7 TaxID=1037410 RepID=F9UKK6_9BACT|nr:HPr family phosphocarrier protein [Mycoplasmopsis columbina]EGV00211.1 phosphocarrier protein hpr [Mycoplasmopsis columbina SF7]VEU77103.1 phosphocarrier protein HPr [Mycoplasmopsis columbina]